MFTNISLWAITLGNVQASFHATGLLPIDESRILHKLKLNTLAVAQPASEPAASSPEDPQSSNMLPHTFSLDTIQKATTSGYSKVTGPQSHTLSSPPSHDHSNSISNSTTTFSEHNPGLRATLLAKDTHSILTDLSNNKAPPTPAKESNVRPIVLAAQQLSSTARFLSYTAQKCNPPSVDSQVLSLTSSLATTSTQISSLLRVSAKAAQKAMAERDMYKAELAKLREQLKNKPQEATIDSRRRDYGELLTTEDVLAKRREEAEKNLQIQLGKDQRAADREERAREREVAERARVQRAREVEEARVAKREREQNEKEEKARERERQKQERERIKEEQILQKQILAHERDREKQQQKLDQHTEESFNQQLKRNQVAAAVSRTNKTLRQKNPTSTSRSTRPKISRYSSYQQNPSEVPLVPEPEHILQTRQRVTRQQKLVSQAKVVEMVDPSLVKERVDDLEKGVANLSVDGTKEPGLSDAVPQIRTTRSGRAVQGPKWRQRGL